MPRRALCLFTLTAAACASQRTVSAPPPLHPDPVATSQAAASVAAATELTGPLRLATLLPSVLSRSPAVLAARARLEAAAEVRPQAISLADPMAEVTYFTRNAMDPSDSFHRYELMIRQDFPFPTVLALRGDAATKEAEAEALRYEAVVRDAVAELKEIHAERAYLFGAARVQSALRDVYIRYADLARAGTASGGTRLAESFRAESLLAQAGYELTVIEELRAAEDQRLRSLLALPAGSALGEPADAPPPRVDVDVAELSRRALAYNQELRAAGVEVEAAGIGARQARWQYAPTFSIGGGQMVNDEYDVATGRTFDSSVVTFGLTLPIWFGAREAAVRESDAKVRAARAAESGERERLLAEVARAAFRLRNAGRLVELYSRQLGPEAEQALLRSQSMMEAGKETLASSLELAATWQSLRIAELRAVADQAQALAALERLLGTSVAAAPAELPR